MRSVFTIYLLAALSACSKSEYSNGTNFLLKSNESIYINQQDNEFKLINRESGEFVVGQGVVNDAMPVNEIVKNGYIQIKFERPAFGVPSSITLQLREAQPYLCNECSAGMKEWSRERG